MMKLDVNSERLQTLSLVLLFLQLMCQGGSSDQIEKEFAIGSKCFVNNAGRRSYDESFP